MSTITERLEEWGLEVIAELEDSSGCYEFDTHLAFKHADGRLFYAHDAGCSCPIPFEDYDSIESLDPVTKENFEQLRDNIMAAGKYRCSTIGERHKFITEIKKHLKL